MSCTGKEGTTVRTNPLHPAKLCEAVAGNLETSKLLSILWMPGPYEGWT